MFRILSATFVLWVCLRGVALAEVLYTIQELLPLPGYTVAHANAINDSGQVVGYSYQPHTLDSEGFIDSSGSVSATLWDGQSAFNIGAAQSAGGTVVGFNATDINNLGQIVGTLSIATHFLFPPFDSGVLVGTGWDNWATVAPGSLASVPPTGFKCNLDSIRTAITDTGYMLGSGGAIFSPNTGGLCGVDVLELYESGLALTTEGYLFDPLVNGVQQWVTVPDCSGATGVASEVCALADGELHNKLMNESGQLILNVGDRAFLLTPCSPFPGGGATEGCFPAGVFPAPEPTTLALLGIALAGLGFSRRKRS